MRKKKKVYKSWEKRLAQKIGLKPNSKKASWFYFWLGVTMILGIAEQVRFVKIILNLNN